MKVNVRSLYTVMDRWRRHSLTSRGPYIASRGLAAGGSEIDLICIGSRRPMHVSTPAEPVARVSVPTLTSGGHLARGPSRPAPSQTLSAGISRETTCGSGRTWSILAIVDLVR